MIGFEDNEVLWQLFRNGPTWDGDLVSKTDRDELLNAMMSHKVDGWNYLTYKGMVQALKLKYDRRKEKDFRR